MDYSRESFPLKNSLSTWHGTVKNISKDRMQQGQCTLGTQAAFGLQTELQTLLITGRTHQKHILLDLYMYPWGLYTIYVYLEGWPESGPASRP
jgi:hypothetical protein